MNKKLLVSFVLASLTGISTQAKEKMSSETTQQRPNIILFMVDDMGWQDTSLPFWTQKTHYNEAYETPNMERLAKKGMMFTQAYACNISSATRCSLITGANNTRHRVTNWTLEKNKATDRPSNTIELPDWNYNGVSQVTGTPNTFVGTSFVELLRQNGYHTIHCGKHRISQHFNKTRVDFYSIDVCYFSPHNGPLQAAVVWLFLCGNFRKGSF